VREDELDELMLLSPEDLARLQSLRRCYDRLRAGGRGHEEAKGHLARRWIEYGGVLAPGELDRATSDAFAGGCALVAPSPRRPLSSATVERLVANIQREVEDRGREMTREQVIEKLKEYEPEAAALFGPGPTYTRHA